MWEDVDKDLGELLEQTDKEIAVKDEDEDEDSTTTTERYGDLSIISLIEWNQFPSFYEAFINIFNILLFFSARYDRFKNSEKTSNSDDENIKIEDIDGKNEVNEENKE